MINDILASAFTLWAALAVILLVVELSTAGFFIVCFSIGAAAAAIGALFGGFALQLVLFIAFSALSICTVRPFALKYLHRNEVNRPSNADAMIGHIGTVSEPIAANGYGRVAIDGSDWKAKTANGEPVARGERVKIVGRESIIITVEKL